MKYEGRQNKYLHESVRVLFLDFDEIKLIGFLYIFALQSDVLIFWLNLFIAPLMIIPYKRKQSRGFFGQFLYSVGYMSMTGYPNYDAFEFEE